MILAPFSTVYARSAMVCSIDHLASSAGVALLHAGGSAVDAAVGTNAVLTVTAQHMCGLGGDLFALVHRPGDARPAVLNASGRAGSGADPERLRAEGQRRMPFTGDIRSVPVPGCVDGWLALHERFGRLPLADVLEPARRYAADGFPATPFLAAATQALAGVEGADDFTLREPLAPGSVVRRPAVARTLAGIARNGRTAFYGGEFGEALLRLGAGEYAPDDLERPLADWIEPLGLDVWDRRLWTVPPSSQGYLALAGAWLAARLGLPADPDDPRWAHGLVEAAKQAAWDRPRLLHQDADGAELLAPDRLERQLRGIDPRRAAALPGEYRAGGTVFLCARDGDGMGVSLIQSNYAGWGALLVAPGTGIFLQNRGAGFSLEPGHPAEYGPRRRPPHTLSPLLVTRSDGSLDTLLGTMGGDSQPQILLQLLVRRYAAGQSPGGAVAAPRWVLAGEAPALGGTWAGDDAVTVVLEGHRPSWRKGLEARGHRVAEHAAGGHEFGHAHLISVEGDHLAGAADPRSLAGAALGI